MNGYELINTIVTQKIGLRTSKIFIESQNSKFEGKRRGGYNYDK